MVSAALLIQNSQFDSSSRVESCSAVPNCGDVRSSKHVQQNDLLFLWFFFKRKNLIENAYWIADSIRASNLEKLKTLN